MGDLSSTKTNMGTAFVDIYTQTNSDGKSVQIDNNGKTQVRLMVFWDKIGTGTHSVQVLEVGTSNVFISMDVVSGRNTSALTNIPAFATLPYLKVQEPILNSGYLARLVRMNVEQK
jgi:hypothetical protein